MIVDYLVGVNRIFYKSVDFGEGKTITAYLWSPGLIKSDLQIFTEISGGLYFLDYNFLSVGKYLGIFYENDSPSTFCTFKILTNNIIPSVEDIRQEMDDNSLKLASILAGIGGGVGTGPVLHIYTTLTSATATPPSQPIADVTVIMSTDASGQNPIHQGRTDALGKIYFYPNVPSGTTVYLWRFKTGIDFVNPDVEVTHS